MTSTTIVQTWKDHGPGAILVPNGVGKSKLKGVKGETKKVSHFALDHGNWVALQTWVQNVKLLPNDPESMKDFLDPPHTINYKKTNPKEFDDLAALYKNMQGTVDNFIGFVGSDGGYVEGSYDTVIKFTQSLMHYASRVKIYYKSVAVEIKHLVDEILAGGDNVKALKHRLLLRLSRIKKWADDLLVVAKQCAKLMTDNHATVKSQKEQLDRLQLKYKAKYATDDASIKALLVQLAAKRNELATDTGEQVRDYAILGVGAALVVSAPWYTFGAGALVGLGMMIFGGVDSAKQAEQIAEDENEIARLTAEITLDQNLQKALQLSNQHVDDLDKDFASAVAACGQLRDIISTLSSNVGDLHDQVNMVDEDAKEMPEVLLGLSKEDPGDLDIMVKEWAKVGQDAEAFTASAHAIIVTKAAPKALKT